MTSFSLLLPVYRGDSPEFFTEAFCSSVHEQSLRPDEVILVQDGPVSAELEEALWRAVQESPVPTRLFVLPQNEGLAAALDRGLAECSHDVVARMDADDVSLPQRFAVQIPLLEEGYDLVGSSLLEIGEDSGDVLGKRVPPLGSAEIQRAARFHSPFNHPSVVYRRSAVLDAGGYRPLHLMEDYWLFARMLARGARVRNIEDALVLYRVGGGSYARRGGARMLRSEVVLQWRLWREGFTTTTDMLRNLAVRGGYRLVPEGVRRWMYRLYFHARNPSLPNKTGDEAHGR